MKRSGKITDLFQSRTNKLPKTTDTDNIGNIESVENENEVSTSINFDSQVSGSDNIGNIEKVKNENVVSSSINFSILKTLVRI